MNKKTVTLFALLIGLCLAGPRRQLRNDHTAAAGDQHRQRSVAALPDNVQIVGSTNSNSFLTGYVSDKLRRAAIPPVGNPDSQDLLPSIH